MLTMQIARRLPKKGFTKTELLFVVVGCLILLSLLVPSVRRPRGPHRKTTCANNMRNIGLAAIQFEMRRGHFPPYLQSFGRYDPAVHRDPTRLDFESPAHAKIGTWAVMLLADLDNQPVHEFWTINDYALLTIDPANPSNVQYDGNKVPSMEIFQCPSDAFNDVEPFGKNSYTSNNGTFAGTFSKSLGDVDSESSANGIFNFHGNHPNTEDATKLWPESRAVGPKTTAEDIIDGTSHTALFTENVQATAWHKVSSDPRILTLPDVYQQIKPRDVEAFSGFLWHYADEFGPAGTPKPTQTMRANGGDIYTESLTFGPSIQLRARPSSLHTGGFNMTFADGGVRFVSDSIDYRVYQALMTPHGAKSNVPNPDFAINDEDL